MSSAASEQDAQLERVSVKIARYVLAFCAARIREDPPDFHMEEMQTWVRNQIGIAPDSPSRILRDLRLRGKLDYTVVNRRESHYRLKHVADIADEERPRAAPVSQ